MNSFNPFSMMMNMMNPMASQRMMMPPFPQKTKQNKIPINQQQFKQLLPNLNDGALQQIVEQARAQGISEDDIKAGINFLNQLNK